MKIMKQTDYKQKHVPISDEELKYQICERLKENPVFYIDLLKHLIDAVPAEISDDDVIALLTPSFGTYHGSEIIDGLIIAGEMTDTAVKGKLGVEDFVAIPTTESIDRLFSPEVRKKLYQLQVKSVDPRLPKKEREDAKSKLIKALGQLSSFVEQGRPEALSEDLKRKIMFEYSPVETMCRTLLDKHGVSHGSRNIAIKKNFPDVGEKVVKEIDVSMVSVEKLRDLILAKRYDCTERSIQDLAREEFSIFKELMKSGNGKSIRRSQGD
jgi:hypothetical protein